MTKGLIFTTLELFEERNQLITEQVIIDGIECEQYATPLNDERGYFMQIADGFEKYFTDIEINNSVDYKPLENEETIEL